MEYYQYNISINQKAINDYNDSIEGSELSPLNYIHGIIISHISYLCKKRLNKEVDLSYSLMKKSNPILKIDPKTYSKRIKELEDHGLLTSAYSCSKNNSSYLVNNELLKALTFPSKKEENYKKHGKNGELNGKNPKHNGKNPKSKRKNVELNGKNGELKRKNGELNGKNPKSPYIDNKNNNHTHKENDNYSYKSTLVECDLTNNVSSQITLEKIKKELDDGVGIFDQYKHTYQKLTKQGLSSNDDITINIDGLT